MGIFNDNIHNPHTPGSTQGPVGPKGPPGPGFKFTRDGNFNVEGKRLTNVGAPTEDDDTTTKKYVDDGMSGKVSTDMVMTLGRPEGEKIVRYLPNPGGEEKNVGLITHKLYIEDEFNDSVILQADDQDFDDVHLYIPNLKNYDNSGGRRKSNLVVNSIDNTFSGKLILPSGHIIIKDGDNQVLLNRADILKIYESSSHNIISNKVPLYSDSGGLYCDLLKMRNRNRFIIIKPDAQSRNNTIKIPNLHGVDRTVMLTSTHQTIRDNQTFTEPITCNKAPTSNNHLTTKDYVDTHSSNGNYLKTDGSVAMTGDLNMNEQRVKNTLDPSDEQDTVNKRYLESQLTDYLKRNGQSPMTFDLNMNSYKIVNLKDITSSSNDSEAVNKKYVDDKTKINPSHSLTNSFKFLMDDLDEISTEYGLIADKIDDLSWSPHENKKVLYFKALKDGLNYRYRLGFQMTQASPIANTIAIEQLFNNENYWNKAEISINGTGITIESYHTNKFHFISNATNYYYTKTIVQLKRLTAPEHQLYYTTHIDNVTSSPIQLQQYLLVYGVNSFMSDVDSIVYHLTLFKNVNDKMQMQVDLDMNNKKITNVVSPTNKNDIVNKNYVDLLVLGITYNRVPIINNLTLSVFPSLNLMTVDQNNKVSEIINLIDNKKFKQQNINKQPSYLFDNEINKHYLYFDGVNDIMEYANYTSNQLGGSTRNTSTIFLLIKTYDMKNQTQIFWGENDSNKRFYVHLPWSNGIVYVRWGSKNFSSSNLSNVTGEIELWTIRISPDRDPDQNIYELFRGTNNVSPIIITDGDGLIPSTSNTFYIGAIGGSGGERYFSKMNLYALLIYNKSLSDKELKRMFIYFQNEFLQF